MTPSTDSTLNQLRQAMAAKGDFPAVSCELTRIMRMMKDDENADDKLIELILSDFALTQKVLRLANSAMYSAYGRTVATIPLAIYVLGTETIGHLALSLTLLESLGHAASTERAHDELTKSTVAGAVARTIGASVSQKAGESLAVASLLRGLGKMLVCFYLPEKFEAIEAHHPTLDDEHMVVLALLGLSYDDIATAVAASWKLPSELQELVTEPPADACADLSWVHSVTGYSRRYVEVVAGGGGQLELSALAARFAEATGVPASDLLAQAGAAIAEAQKNESMPAAKFLENAKKKTPVVATPLDTAGQAVLLKLTNGVSELAQAKVNLKPTQVLGMAAELLWTTLGGSRFMLFLHNRQSSTFDLMTGRGDGVQALVRNLKFEETFAPNVVHLALLKATSVYMHDAVTPSNAAKLPGWLKASFPPAKSLLLLPLATGGHATGLMYLDWGPDGRATPPTPAEMIQLERLRVLVSEALHAVRAGK